MDYVTSLSEILQTLKFSNMELNKEEEKTLNSIFNEVDKWDDDGNSCPTGDGRLNSKEYYMFSKLIQNAKSLFEKFSQTMVYGRAEKFNDLSILFLDNSIDEDFIKNLSEEEITDFINNMSFEDNIYQIDKSKAESLFNIQLELLKNNNCYTDDLKNLVNMLLLDYDNTKYDNKFSLDSLKTHFNGRLSATRANKDVEIKEPNGKIDADFKQGYTGDCWLLSSIKAISSDEKGLEKLNSMISVQKSGDKLISVTVHLQGKDYIISSEELHAAIEYSTGDLDVRALEIAVNRYCLENSYKDVTGGGHAGFGYSILLGDEDSVKEFAKKKPQDFNINPEFQNDLKTRNRVGTIGGASCDKYAIDVKTGEKVKLVQFHEYAIVGSDNEFVYLTNPHDTSQKLKLEIDDIKETFSNGFLYNIT